MNEIIEKVSAKLAKEIQEGKCDPKAKVIIEPVKAALLSFCEQEAEFAQAILETDKPLTECCNEIVKGISTGISDLDVYKKAVKFYFPGADIKFNMTIDLCASVAGEAAKTLKVNLLDLMG